MRFVNLRIFQNILLVAVFVLLSAQLVANAVHAQTSSKPSELPNPNIGQADDYDEKLRRAITLIREAQQRDAEKNGKEALRLSEEAVRDARIVLDAPEGTPQREFTALSLIFEQSARFLDTYSKSAGAHERYQIAAKTAEYHNPITADLSHYHDLENAMQMRDEEATRTNLNALVNASDDFMRGFESYPVPVDLTKVRLSYLKWYVDLDGNLYRVGLHRAAIEFGERLRTFAERHKLTGHEIYARLLTNLCLAYGLGLAEYQKAQPLAEQALSHYQALHGPQSDVVGGAHSNLAVVYQHLNQIPQARKEFETAIAILRKANTELGVYFLSQTSQSWSVFLTLAGDNTAAKRAAYEAFEVVSKKFGFCAPSTRQRYQAYISYLITAGSFQEARLMAERSIKEPCPATTADTPFSDRPPEDVEQSVMEGLAWTFHEIGQFAEAMSLVKKLEELQASHPNVRNKERIGLMKLKAAVLSDQKRWDEALDVMKATVSLLEAEPRDETNAFSVAEAYRFLGALYRNNHDTSSALPILDRAVEMVEKFAPASLDLGLALGDRARARSAAGDKNGAEKDIGRSIEILSQVLQPGYPDLAYTHLMFADLLKESGRLDEAWSHAKTASEDLERALGPNQEVVATAKATLGGIAFQKKDWKAAEQYYRSALQSAIAASGRDNPSFARYYADLSRVLIEQKRSDEAFEAARSAAELYDKRAIAGEGLFARPRSDYDLLSEIIELAFTSASQASSTKLQSRGDLLFRLAQRGFADATAQSVALMTARLQTRIRSSRLSSGRARTTSTHCEAWRRNSRRCERECPTISATRH